MIYGILPHKYDVISGVFLKYLQKIKKNQQHLPAYIFKFAWFYCRQPLKTILIFLAHIFFDDAFELIEESGELVPNEYVIMLASLMNEAAR